MESKKTPIPAVPYGSKENRTRSQIPLTERERTPSKNSGWRELKQHADKIRRHVDALSYSVWYRAGVMAVSALEVAEAPDGRGDSIPQWHISFAGNGRRSTDDEVRAALVCFGMAGAEEDNHHPGGGARHFWVPVDPARRVDCECKEAEKVVVEADGYRSTTPVDGPCSGCELAAVKRSMGASVVCPLHPVTT